MKKLTALLIFCTCFLFAKADTFIVTSNGDSGPGTLREAIMMANANGTATTDYIHFNLADISIGGRTISVQTLLPDLNSNLVIDGSIQPGNKIGVSDAKIRITAASGRLEYAFRIIDNKNISFLGLHIDNVYSPQGSFSGGVAIAIMNAENISIGALGKGNYFTKLNAVVDEANLQRAGKGMTNGLVFKSNVINLSEDGNSTVSSALTFALDNVRNLELGGENEAEGNYIAGGAIGWTYTDTLAHVNLGYYKILNNKFGCNYLQTAALKCGELFLRNGNAPRYTDTTEITIKGNTFNSGLVTGTNWGDNFIRIEGKKGFIDIKANKVGLLSGNHQFFFSNVLSAFIIGGCEDGIIGGDNPLDTNIVAGVRGYAVALGNNRAVKITKNSFYCNSNGIIVSSAQLPVPDTKIFTITDHLVEGTTLPNSKVEVFLTKMCTGCDNGKTYLGFTMADAAGAWSFTSPVLLDGAVTATGTTSQNVTGEFANPEYRFDNFLTIYPTCQQNNGSIKGIRFVAGTRYYWLRSHAGRVDSIFTEEVINAGPGSYTFVVEQGKYCSVKYAVTLSDLSPKINSQNKIITQPSCGLNNGRIFNHGLNGRYNKIIWKDGAGNIVGNTADLQNVGAGQYKLIILDTIYGCGDSTEFYTLVNQSGPSLNTNAVQITSATCSANNGSITGMTASNINGTPIIHWVDSTNKIVGTGYDLLNVPPGKYRMKFRDASNCDTITTPFYAVGDIGQITIDTTTMTLSPAKCTGTGGSIQNITVTGGNAYEWKNIATGMVVGNTASVSNLPSGNYQLTVTTSVGCTKTSPVITVPQASFIPIGISVMKTYLAFCGLPNGSIQPQTFTGDTSLYTFRWVDSTTSQTIGHHTQLYNIYGGTYLLYATDSNGCERMIRQATIINAPVPNIDYRNMQVTPDNCMAGQGGINGILVNDLRNGAGSYVWKNSAGDSIGNSLNIQNLSPGSYELKVTDIMGCTVTSSPIKVDNRNSTLPNPLYDEQTILKNTTATLKVKNPRTGTYQLFDDAAAAFLLQENTTGDFTTPLLTADKVFYLRYVNGVCSSEVVPVKITVVDKTAIYVPSAFTPNNDGRNDILKVITYGKVKLVHFTIYNRWGQVAFQTTNANTGWNGTIERQLASSGVYVWVVKAIDELTGKTINEKGTVTIIR